LQKQEMGHTAPQVKRALRTGRALLLFDGVDEVPLTQRARVWQAIGALRRGPFADCPWLATCRTLSYNETDAETAGAGGAVMLAELSPAQVKTFVTAWFDTLQAAGDITVEQARGWTERLLQAAAGTLSHLAGNPMLLTIMALVQTSRATLPQERVKLYLACVETLLFRWQQRKETAEAELPAELARLGLKPEAVQELLAEIAWTAHNQQTERRDEPADIPAGTVQALARKHLQDAEKATLFLNYTEQRAHLLVGRGGQDQLYFGFPHRTFQEYLAARVAYTLFWKVSETVTFLQDVEVLPGLENSRVTSSLDQARSTSHSPRSFRSTRSASVGWRLAATTSRTMTFRPR